MMIKQFVGIFFLTLLAVVVVAFSPPPKTTRNRQGDGVFSAVGSTRRVVTTPLWMRSSNGTDTTTTKAPATSLTALTEGLLQSHREMKAELQELETAKKKSSSSAKNKGIATAGEDGVYRIISEEQYHNFMRTNSDKLIILKFTTPFCMACKKLKQKFHNLHQREAERFPRNKVVLGDIMISNNPNVEDPFRDFVTKELGITKIPLVRFHTVGDNNEVPVDSFRCDKEGCSWPELKTKMIDFVVQYDDIDDDDDNKNDKEEVTSRESDTMTSKKIEISDPTTKEHGNWLNKIFQRRGN